MKLVPDNPFRPQGNPHCRSDWQTACNIASYLLTMARGEEWGMIHPTAGVNYERCRDILQRAKVLGIEPRLPGMGEEEK